MLLFIAAQILARPIAAIFVGYDLELLDLTVHAFRIFLLSFILAGGNMFVSAFFTSLNNGTVSAVISTVRTMGFELISVIVLPLIWGPDGIWSAVFVAEIASMIMSFGFLIIMNKKYRYFKGSF